MSDKQILFLTVSGYHPTYTATTPQNNTSFCGALVLLPNHTKKKKQIKAYLSNDKTTFFQRGKEINVGQVLTPYKNTTGQALTMCRQAHLYIPHKDTAG